MTTPASFCSRLALVTGLLAAAFATTSATAGERTPDTVTYRTMDFPGGSSTIIWGLNDRDELAGQYAVGGGTSHAMTYRHGKFEALAPARLGNAFSAAGGPGDDGTSWGGFADATGVQHGFVLRNGRFETVDFRGHLNSNIDAVDDCGRLLGVYWDADGAFHGMLSQHGNETPFDVDGARDTYPLGMNGAGDSVGYWDADGATTHGYLRQANGRVTTIDVPAAVATVAFAINDRGQVAGYYADAAGGLHGFVKTGQHVQQLDVPTGVATIVTTINNHGSVAGEYFDAAGVRHGFVATLE